MGGRGMRKNRVGKRLLALVLIFSMFFNIQNIPVFAKSEQSAGTEQRDISESAIVKGISYPDADPSYQSGPYYKNLLNVNLTGNQRDDIVAVAQSQVGYMDGGNRNDISGTSQNHGGYTEYGHYVVGGGGKGYAWCAMFVSWCAQKANIGQEIIRKSTFANPNTFGVTYYARETHGPQKGDLIFFKGKNSTAKNWSHVGIVTGADANFVYTVEGNNNDCVRNVRYPLNHFEIKGYGVPNYRNNITKFPAPTISSTDILSGKGITISAPGCDAIYYSVDGSANMIYGGRLDYAEGHTIRACAIKAGYQASDPVSYSFSVPKALNPVLVKSEKAEGTTVSFSANNPSEQIYYSLDGGGFIQYTNTFTLTKTTSIQYYGRLSGYADSDRTNETILVSKPDIPSISVKNETDKIAVGENAILSWNRLSNAAGYRIRITKDSEIIEEKTVEGISTAYMLSESGIYQFEVEAYNVFGNSGYSSKVSVQAMPDVTVQFQDWDGTPLTEKYQIKYGSSAEPPKSPSRLGYDFQGWQGNYTNVTSDTVITAKYEKKSFYVTFCDQDGTVVSRQRVEWDDAAKAPDMSERAAIGYAFSGWNVDPKESDWEDYTKVEGKMLLYATYAWENDNLPVAIRDLSAFCTYNSAGQHYKVDMRLYCTPTKDIRGRIVVEIKTSKGTTVAIGMQDITLEAGNTEIEKSVQVNSTADGTIVNVYIVGMDEKENTIGAYSKMASAKVEREVFYSEWSEWSENLPDHGEGDIVEEKEQYRYNTLITATSTTSRTMDGYTLVSTTPQVGNWSAWQDNAIGAFHTDSMKREVEGQQVYLGSTCEYGHYCTGNVAGAQWCTSSSNTTVNGTFNAHCIYHSLGTFDSNDGRFQYDSSRNGYQYYPNGSRYQCSNSCWTWYRMNTNDRYKWQWRYRDTTYLYTFQKTSDWSAWADERPSSYNALETRTMYRVKKVTDANTPNETDREEKYSLSGTIKDTDSDLSGKTATVLVYKRSNTDPTQSQMEYVDQIVIGENNSYEITVMPKELLSETTGDFIVALAVEGATKLINIDTIYAPKPEYTVTFLADGQVVSEQKVHKNESAQIPNAPKIAGKEFAKWDTSASNITEDTLIYAIYTEKQYTVVYLDEMNGTAKIQKANYNDPVIAEIKNVPEGYEFKGWNAEIVTEDMIVRAVYGRAEYEVQFKDVNDKTISSQKVTYGESALPPDFRYIKVPDGMQITGWSKDVSWWEVTEDMIVYPLITYDSVTEMPYTDTDLELLFIDRDNLLPADEAEPQTISLRCNTPDSVIYYTLDGRDPVVSEEVSEGTHIYSKPIKVTGNMIIKACASVLRRDISDTFELEIQPEVLAFPDGFSGGDENNNQPETPQDTFLQTPNGSGNKTDTGIGTDKTNIFLKATSIKGKITAKKKAFLLKWKKQSGVTGYQIQYSTSGKFTKKTTKIKTVKGASKKKLTVKKLKAKKKYFVRIRTYKIVNGTTYYSKWSKVGMVKTKK